MSNEIVLDIETQNTFQEVGAYNPALLKVSLVGVYSYQTDEYTSFLEDELPKLWPILEHADRIIGYNINGFDLPVLAQYYPGDLLRFPTLDIMQEIERVIGFRIKLDDVAKATLGVGKNGHGLQAVEFFRNGEIEKLRTYCLHDVKVTKEVYEFGKANQRLEYVDRLGRRSPVTVNFVPAASRAAVNLTMGL